MSARVAYPFKRISVDDLDATVEHDLEDAKNVVLNVVRVYQYKCKIAPSRGSWEALWENAGVVGGTLIVYWVAGGAGSRELLQRRVNKDDLPQVGEEDFNFSFDIPGYQHTERAAVLFRVISTDRKSGDDLGAEQGGILWEKSFPVVVSGDGGYMKVEYAAAPADAGLSAGPGEYSYSPDRGYELVVYTSHLPGGSHAGAPAIHGAVAVLLERVLRHAFARLKELAGTNLPNPGSGEDEDEIHMLKDILGSEHKKGRKSPLALLQKEGEGEPLASEHALFNWCWEAAGSIAHAQVDALRESVELRTEGGEEK